MRITATTRTTLSPASRPGTDFETSAPEPVEGKDFVVCPQIWESGNDNHPPVPSFGDRRRDSRFLLRHPPSLKVWRTRCFGGQVTRIPRSVPEDSTSSGRRRVRACSGCCSGWHRRTRRCDEVIAEEEEGIGKTFLFLSVTRTIYVRANQKGQTECGREAEEAVADEACPRPAIAGRIAIEQAARLGRGMTEPAAGTIPAAARSVPQNGEL